MVTIHDSSQTDKKAFGDKEAEVVVAGIIKARAVDTWTKGTPINLDHSG